MSSIANEIIRHAVRRGYTADHTGQLFNPKGKPVKGIVRKHTRNRKGKGSGVYLIRKYNLTHPTKKYCSRPISAHRLIAYMKYGEAVFEAECVRHLNDNSLDNSWDNIALGTYMDNHLDAVRNGKAKPKKVKPPKQESIGERLQKNIDIAISLKAEGLTNKKIGELFGLSERMVRYHIKAHS